MHKNDETKQAHSGQAITQSAANPIPEYTTDQLFGPRNELLIRHNGEQYRLRITRQAKLILTK